MLMSEKRNRSWRSTAELASSCDARLRDVLGDLDGYMRRGVVEQAQDGMECDVQDLPDRGHDVVVSHPVDCKLTR